MDRRFPPTIYSKMARSIWCSRFSTGISCSPTPTTAILLEPDVAYRRSGDVYKLLVPLLSTYRYEGDEISVPLAKKEAKILNEKISGKACNDVELIRIFSTRSKPQLNATLNYYNNEFSNAINKDLKADKDDEFLQLLRQTIISLTVPEKNFEKALDKIRFESFPDKSKLNGQPELFIPFIPDKNNNTLTIIDSGIGMTKAEIFPLAFMIVSVKTVDNWRWFLQRISDVLLSLFGFFIYF